MFVVAGHLFSVEGEVYVDVGVTLTGSTSVSFQLKAAKDAHVGLTSQRGVYTANSIYEIVLGGTNNEYVVIRQVCKSTE